MKASEDLEQEPSGAEPSSPDSGLAPATARRTLRDDGATILDSPVALGAFAETLHQVLEERVAEHPGRLFLAERAGSAATDADAPWRQVDYRTFHDDASSLAHNLLASGIVPGTPVLILSGNSIDHATLAFGAMRIGSPVAPVSAAYSLLSKDHRKLLDIASSLEPGVVFAEDGAVFAAALQALSGLGATTLVSRNPRPGDRLLEDWLGDVPGPEAEAAATRVGAETVAKVLFTSGSTGSPKGVINTHRMLCSNQQAIRQLWPFLASEPPIIVDWLPWSHTFGANHNFNMVLENGGTLYIDGGKPAPGLLEATLDNLRLVSPTLYFNVPRGFDMLLPHLESDAQLRRSFFRRLRLIFYAGASLPPHLWRRLEELAIEELGRPVLFLSAWGATETAPLATSLHFPVDGPGVIGNAIPGTTIKLVPTGDKLELRVRGPNVTPGYWRDDTLTETAFDEEGFFRTGDAGRLVDDSRPERGILFDGRTAENFKLSSGTWVHVGALRVAAVAAGEPLIQDAVVCGHDRDEIGLLIFPNLEACRRLSGRPEASLTELATDDAVTAHLTKALGAFAGEETPGSSSRIGRFLVLGTPPDIDAGEITDKGYVNQSAVLARRAERVEQVYRGEPPAVVLS